MSDFSKSRLVGLDIARSVAILAVVLAHTRYLLDAPGRYEFLSLSGKIGVELFFVLSGFLIGSILLRSFEESLSFRMLVRFWSRRWLRTLPAYFAVLIFIWLVFDRFDLLYFLFLQDLVVGDWDLLPVSWSLVIEEWFYLLFAPLCLILMRYSLRWGFLAASVLLLLSGVVLLSGDYAACVDADRPLKCFENDIRKFTFRFTSLGLGTTLAWVNYYHNLPRLLEGRRLLLLVTTLLVHAFMFWFCGSVVLDYPGVVNPTLGFLFFYPAMGFASLLLIMLLYVWQPRLSPWVAAPVSFVSLTSYSNYLWHLLINEQMRGMEMNQYLLVLLFLIATLIVSAVSYLLVEKPFMGLRNRFFP